MASFGIPPIVDLAKLPLWAQSGGSFWLPPPDSTTAEIVDRLFYFILAVAAFFFLLIVVLMVLFVVLFRRRPGVGPAGAPSHNAVLEVVWSVIPVAIVMTIFFMGFTGYMEMRTSPREAYEIHVLARKWEWRFDYPNGAWAGDLHVPVDQPVRLVMTSDDVIHSLFIPAFRVKMDLVPGRYTQTWFHARRPGQYQLYCTEYCGTGHSDMLAKVVVHEPGTFQAWLEETRTTQENLSPAEKGEMLYRKSGCGSCHSIDGTPMVGPTLKGVFGQQHRFTDGSSGRVDENYIRQSIMEPGAEIREGYSNQMPTYRGRLKDREITVIIEFIKSLK